MISRNLNAFVGCKIARIAGNDTEMEIMLSNGSTHTFLGKNGCVFSCPEFDYAQGVLKKHARITSAKISTKVTLNKDSLLYETTLSIDVGSDNLSYHWEMNSVDFMTSVIDYMID